MTIITWNCNMAFRKKASFILKYKPDILIVPECECIKNLAFGEGIQQPTDMLWYGTNQHKGLGIFSYGSFKLKLLKNHNPELKMIIPIAVTGGHCDFTLYAVWANNPADPDGQYVEQVWKALHHYDKKIKTKQTILIGDFNSNSIWDRKYREGNHSNVVEHLEQKGIISCYHSHHQQVQGQELHPTFYLYRHKDKPYHLDYCFASSDMMDSIEQVEIGDYDFWKQYSDHVPVIVTFKS
ncbi:MAG: Endonuclease/Exonuclease/phosphatase family protein [Ferruginibacter sp.]|jgi:exodeoxyribonuclease-3|uniref:endonuclease/exonuclease/phosphatase family protein n=1 Tax=Ferruginibacter sp. TaxID=1940288 RepID=UPI00265A8047|nr:endonuclease/exonuclease/phosphatase family protein [Ferruginibacter sp.]MDB5279162.1 Endonuclease/Exonuclease/phosphatase family protein [Ferruginibacter sp.]